MIICMAVPICSWLEPLFWIGYRRKSLQAEDLYAHPQEVDSQRLLKDFNRSAIVRGSRMYDA